MRSPDVARSGPEWTSTTPGESDGTSGETTAELARFGRRYPAVGRAVVGVACGLAGPLMGPPCGVSVAVVVAVVVIGWNLAFLALVLPDGRPGALLSATYVVDLVLVCGLCLAKPLLVDAGLQRASLGWISPVASFTVVALQFWLRPRAATAATLAVSLAFVTGTAWSPGLTAWDGLLVGGGWMVVEAVLARLLWRLLLRGGREADRLLQARFAAERAAATAAARRADQRAHWATVHDTSATTLLMIGLGEVAGTEEWLPGQLRRDMALLAGTPPDGGDGGATDVCTGLRAAADRAHVRVGMDCPAGTTAPPAVVTALVGATAEALENVRRHAGTGTARLVLRRGPVSTAGEVGSVEVTVADDGPGFDPAAVGPHRFGLAWSVHDRMQAVGGLATVESAPGRGTVVRLRWPA